ncbi:MAG TPA: hypothetical protein VHB72_01575 [Candidatus Saccharimonadales bacterium]|nr:hypothetical protein [Candidatus Saccharimonadales bacterium]
MNVLLLQLFWASFAFIGLVVFLAFYRFRRKVAFLNRFYHFLGSTHVLIVLFMAFATGAALFAAPVLLAYIFEWQASDLSGLYIAVLVLSLSQAFRQRFLAYGLFIKWKRGLTKGSLASILPLLIALGIDYALSLHAGGNLQADSPLHVAKIQLFANNHLTFADPFAGYNGVLDFRYSANLMEALQASAAKLLAVPATTIWFSSYAFYRLVLWLSLFTLTYELLPKRFPREWAYTVAIVLPFMYTGYFFSMAEVPNCFAIAWSSLLLVGMKLLVEGRGSYVFLLAALLTSVTHAATSSVDIVFIGLTMLVLWLAKRPLKQIPALLGGMLMLAVPVAANAVAPSRSTTLPNGELGGDSLHNPIGIFHLGHLVLPKPYVTPAGSYLSIADPLAIGVGIALIAYVIFLRRWLKSRLLKKTVIVLVALAGLSVYNALYASLAGYAFIVYWAKNRRTKLLLVLAIVFYGLIIYNPVVLTAVSGHAPLWLLARFEDLNTIAFIAPVIGLLGLYYAAAKYWDVPEVAKGYGLLLVLIIAVVLPVHRFPLSPKQIAQTASSSRRTNQQDYRDVEQLRQLDPYLDGQVVFTNDLEITGLMGAANSGKPVGFVYTIGSNQAENLQQRINCQQQLFKQLSLGDLQAAKVTRLALIPGNNDGILFYGNDFTFRPGGQPYERAASLKYLKFMKQIGDVRVYAVRSEPMAMSTGSVCNIPRGQ